MSFLVAGLFSIVVPHSLAAPPTPPLGWEEAITEGFDPPIEQTLVEHFYDLRGTRRAHADAWGDDAIPVLQRLYADTEWRRFRPVIREYLDIFDAPARSGDVVGHFQEILPEAAKMELTAGQDFQGAFRDAVRVDADAALAFYRETFAASGAEGQTHLLRLVPSAGPHRHDLLESLLPDTASDEVRAQINRIIELNASARRAQEPIARIVEQERKERTR